MVVMISTQSVRLQRHAHTQFMMMLVIFAIFVVLLKQSFAIRYPFVKDVGHASTTNSRVVSPLDVFEVQAPLRDSYEGASCKQVIVQHNFLNSYGSPYVGSYVPPDCNFTSTIFNMSITSRGINYDRLGLLFIGDVEVWRTTTAMPVRTGIYWNFQKDMTIFDTLLRSNQKIIMSLDNLHDSVFTGNYNVTITALYYDDDVMLTPADEILAISAQKSSQSTSSVLSVPDDNATVSYTIPRNVERAVVSVLASGNGAEEFWYTNVPTEYTATFNNSAVSGYSPFREVQIWIDDYLVGVGWPFPTIFTGGISPALWVPVVGIHTYDLPSFEVDITPWLGMLCNSRPHKFELKVVGYNNQTVLGTVGSNWWVTGSIFLWLDAAGNQTTSTPITSLNEAPNFQFIPHVVASNGTNTTLLVDLRAERTIRHTSTITTSKGSSVRTWHQHLTYTNVQNITTKGYNNTLYQVTSGTTSFSPFETFNISNSSLIQSIYHYPISFYQTYIVPTDSTTTNSTLYAELDHSLVSHSIPMLPYLTSPSSRTAQSTASRLNGSAIYYWNNTYYQFAGAIDPAEDTDGATEQWYSFHGPLQDGTMGDFGRHVMALDGYEPVLVLDEAGNRTIDVPATETVRPENFGGQL